MTEAPVLVTGATGRVGRMVVDLLIDAEVPVRALSRHPESATMLPANVEVVAGDLTEPESLDAGLRGVSAVFLVWTAPPTTAQAVIQRVAQYARRVVFLSAPFKTPHPFFQQPNAMAVLYAEIERLIGSRWARVDDYPPRYVRVKYLVVVGPLRFGAKVGCDGLTARPRRHRSTIAMWQPSRPGP